MVERKPIDPALRRFIDEQVAAWGAPVEMTDEARTRMLRERMVAALQSRGSIPGLPNKVEIRDVEIANGLPARLYTPPGSPGPLPFLVYLHGGGWVAGSVATHDPFCRLLSGAAEVIVASIDFRSAPEHPYPAAVDDRLPPHAGPPNTPRNMEVTPPGLPWAGTALAQTWPQLWPTGSAPPVMRARYALCCCSTPSLIRQKLATPPTLKTPPATASRRTSCVGSGGSTLLALRRAIRIYLRCSYINCLRSRQHWWRQRNTTSCAMRAWRMPESWKQPASLSPACTHPICTTISPYTPRPSRGSRNVTPH
jgi:hypothetical protein